MHLLDWLVVGVYLIWMVWDGVRRTAGSDKGERDLLPNRVDGVGGRPPPRGSEKGRVICSRACRGGRSACR